MTDIFEFFRGELNSDDVSECLKTLHRVKLVACGMKPQLVRSHLFSFLIDFQIAHGGFCSEESIDRLKTMQETSQGTSTVSAVPYVNSGLSSTPSSGDDELLNALAEEWLSVYQFAGGEQYAYLFVIPLEALMSIEETIVRKQAIVTLSNIINSLSPNNRLGLATEWIHPTILWLSQAKFASRASACELIPLVFPHFESEGRSHLERIFASLSVPEETPMTRRATAANIGELFRVMEEEKILKSLISTYRSLWQDETQDTIRASIVDATVPLSQCLSEENNKSHSLPVVLASSADKSWRVRLRLAKNFYSFMKSFGEELTKNYLIQIIPTILADSEQDVKVAAVQEIVNWMELMDEESLRTYLLPSVVVLCHSSVNQVRVSVGEVLGFMAKQFDLETCCSEIVPLVLNFLSDEFHQVRLNSVKNIGTIISYLKSSPTNQQLLEAVRNLINDPQWRIRLHIVNQLPQFAKVNGATAFQQRFQSLFLAAVFDNVFQVREASVHNIRPLADALGPDYVVNNILPRFVDMFSPTYTHRTSIPMSDRCTERHSNYLTRITILHAVPEFSEVLDLASSTDAHATLLPVLMRGLEDEVSNNRLAAISAVLKVIMRGSSFSQSVIYEIRGIVPRLISDSDCEVRLQALALEAHL